MNRLARGALVVVGVTAPLGTAWATGTDLSFDFHRTANTFNCDAVTAAVTACDQISPNGPVNGLADAVFVLLGGVSSEGAGAAQFGIDYSSTG